MTCLQATAADVYVHLLIRVLIAARTLAEFILGRTLRKSIIWCDNQSCIVFLQHRDLSARARHIRVQLGFVYDALDSGIVELRYVPTKQNPANTLTAAEDAPRFLNSIIRLCGLAASFTLKQVQRVRAH